MGISITNAKDDPTGGEFADDKPGNSSSQVPTCNLAGKDDHATDASRTKTHGLTRKELNAFMLAAQSFWFGDRLITTAGYRIEQIEAQNALGARAGNPNAPRVLAEQIVLNSRDLPGT